MTVVSHPLSSLTPVNPQEFRLFGQPGDLCPRLVDPATRHGEPPLGIVIGTEERQVSDGRGGHVPLTYAWVLWSNNPRSKNPWDYTADTVIRLQRLLEIPKSFVHRYHIVKHK